VLHFLRGLIIGFCIAAPVGPISILCVQRTINHGRLYGLVSGLGAATADMFYGAVAALGVAAVARFLVSQQLWLRLVGGLLVLAMGIRTLWSLPRAAQVAVPGGGLVGAYLSTLLLTIANPMTIISFAAVFSGLGLTAGASDRPAAVALLLGVLTGSALWWLILSGLAARMRSRLQLRHMRWLNVAAGMVLAGFGAVMLWSALLT